LKVLKLVDNDLNAWSMADKQMLHIPIRAYIVIIIIITKFV